LRENRLFAVDRHGFSRLSNYLGLERHGLACTTPLGPLAEKAFFAAPTLNRSLLVGSPPPACLRQTDAWSFSSTSWVTMCRQVDPETGPPGLTRLAVISSPLIWGRTARRRTCAIASRRGATLFGAVGEICLVQQERLRRPKSAGFHCISRGRANPFCPPFPRLPGIILRFPAVSTRLGSNRSIRFTFR
jgi:hypothetical protein